MDAALLIARLVLVAVFALAAITKLLDRDGSRQAVAAFGVPPALANPVPLALLVWLARPGRHAGPGSSDRSGGGSCRSFPDSRR